ncbi:hypothetical protein FRB99_006046 [Tulasnella sp. 403]|nr:hypothetical protein FRB99_006046 [Tulasnella sp. 403]
MHTGADDLDANYILDPNISVVYDDDQHQLPSLGSASPPTRPLRIDDEQDEYDSDAGPSHPVPPRLTSADPEDPARRQRLDESQSSTTPAYTAPRAISQLLTGLHEKTFRWVSKVELEEFAIPQSAILDTSAFTGPRNLESLPDFFLQVAPKLHSTVKKRPQSNGAPAAIIVTGAALRVADLVRTCRPLKGSKGGEIAKLFAKHMKLSDQEAYLQRTKVSVAIGTPDRLGKLLSSQDGLKTSKLTHLVLDASYRDSKNQSMLDIPQVRLDFFSSLLGFGKDGTQGGKDLFQLLKSGKVQLVLF